MITREVVQTRLDSKIREYGPRATESIRKLMVRSAISRDFKVRENDTYYNTDEEHVNMSFSDTSKGIENSTGVVLQLHDNAIEQLGVRHGIPGKFLKELYTGQKWERALAAHTLQAFTQHCEDVEPGSGKRIAPRHILVRAVGDEVRGILSDKYRRLNMVPIFTSFAGSVERYGATFWDGVCGDLRSYLEVVIPTIHEIETPNNGMVYVAFGAQISSSDYGRGSLEVRLFEVQGACANGMVRSSVMREIHLGKRMDENFAFSERTYQLDTETVKSAIGDIVDTVFSTEGITEAIDLIKGASAKVLPDIHDTVEELPKLGLTKEEAEAVEALLMRSSPDDGVQGELTVWKVQNAITALARDAEPVRMRELQLAAGKMN